MTHTRIVSLSLAAMLALAGCASDAPAPNSLGLTVTVLEDDRVEGHLATVYGDVDFSSVVLEDGTISVVFDREGTVFASHVDWASYTVDLESAPGTQITADDRFVLRALVSMLEADVGNTTPASDNLIRQGNVWGNHPEGAIMLQQIVADPERGWTTLCGVGSTWFDHDSDTHGLIRETLACGRYETSNPCRDRCGPGCSGVGTSAWTRDCGEHDRCEQTHSGGCNDEFSSASDDFSFAGNCSY